MMSKSFYQKFTLGVLGGGQLGRMLIQSAIDLNIDIAILDPDENAPCKNLATFFTQGSLTDEATVYQFGKACDLVTIEIENVNTTALKRLVAEGIPVYPQPDIIELIQDKRLQKAFYRDHHLPTANFVLTESQADINKNPHLLPGIHKLGKEGYDGRGVQKIQSEEESSKGFEQPGLLEEMIDFEKEISVIVARNASGNVSTFPVVELVFHPEHNLVEYLFAPAQIKKEITDKAESLAKSVIKELDMVGLLAVEMFVLKNGDVLINEIAPRPHNSGHHTIEANHTSQYEQHLRSIMDLPLGETGTIQPAAMVNLLGEDGHKGLAKFEGLDEVLAIEGAHVHLYGKKYTRPFRKMGHVTIAEEDPDRLKEKVDFVKKHLKVIT